MDDLIIRNPDACSNSSICSLLSCFYRFSRRRITPFSFQLIYFIFLSALGHLVLIFLNTRTEFTPRNLDFFFTSVSAATVSSMSTVEMEVFSNPQLIVMTILMFVGGEVFTSMVELFIRRYDLSLLQTAEQKVASASHGIDSQNIELEMIKAQTLDLESLDHNIVNSRDLMYNSIKLLGFMLLGYLLVVNVVGTSLVWIYVSVVSSAKDVLKNKGLNLFTFSIFTTVSTFASCGFVPTNENMIVFKKNSLLLLLLIPQILLGNTLFPSCLRFCIWFFGKSIGKSDDDSKFLLKNTKEIDFLHLLPSQHSKYLVGTVFGFILVQFMLFCSMEWYSNGLDGLNRIEKLIGVLFQCVNSRHTGETIVDISTIAPAILVVFVVMMYLPPYTSFLPSNNLEDGKRQNKKMRKSRSPRIVENLILSQLSYLALFVVLICITERKKMKEDPLNFNVLNIVLEVISAYGNVGFTMGYSCGRQLNPDGNCVDKLYGFSGKWSDGGKIVLIAVMFFGRLKKFNMNGGKAWIIF